MQVSFNKLSNIVTEIWDSDIWNASKICEKKHTYAIQIDQS